MKGMSGWPFSDYLQAYHTVYLLESTCPNFEYIKSVKNLGVQNGGLLTNVWTQWNGSTANLMLG